MGCSENGCQNQVHMRRLCRHHYKKIRFIERGIPLIKIKGKRISHDGYISINANGRLVQEHVAIATKALGRPLPAAAIVHHADGNTLNNANDNLVICPNQAYHYLLHRRMHALDACGNPDWVKCKYCKTWDAL